MRLGLSSYSYRYAVADAGAPLGAAEMLQRAAALQLDFLQICDNVPLHSLSIGELQALGSQAAGLGVAIEVGTRGLNADHLWRYLEIAQTLGSRALRLVLDTGNADKALTQLRAMIPGFEKADVTLAIENHFDLASNNLVALARELGSERVRFCLDTANSAGLLERPLETVAALGELACQVHLKDYIVEKVAVGYHITGRPLGEGWLDVQAVLELLGRRRTTLDYAVELWMDPAASREATLEKEERWIAQSVQTAKSVLNSIMKDER
jgi:sugar phosphate isomerase/epimerase